VGYSASFGTLNGCTAADLVAIDRSFRFRDPGRSYIGPDCHAYENLREVQVGLSLARNQSTEIIHNLGVALGAGFTF